VADRAEGRPLWKRRRRVLITTTRSSLLR
jgi:hypothetical protein